MLPFTHCPHPPNSQVRKGQAYLPFPEESPTGKNGLWKEFQADNNEDNRILNVVLETTHFLPVINDHTTARC